MKKYKNICLSIGSYLIAILWLAILVQIGSTLVATHKSFTLGGTMNFIVLAVFFVFLLIGIFFGSKSNKAKESSWAGNLLMAIGIVLILGYLLLMSGFMGY